MSRIGNYETALSIFGFKAIKEACRVAKEMDNLAEQCKKIGVMKNHLTKEQIEKFKRIKDNTRNSDLQGSISDKIKILKNNKTVLK